MATPLWAQAPSLELGVGIADAGGIASVPLTLSAPETAIQGLVAVVEWDASMGAGEGLVPGPALADAEIVETRVAANFMALGVVIDSDGKGADSILPAPIHEVATLQIRCGDGPAVFPLQFVDFQHAFVGEEPKERNMVVDAGQSVGADEGLELVDGAVVCLVAGRGLLPGDCNRDGALNVSDANCIFGFLFLNSPEQLPCGDGSSGDPANLVLLDCNGDGRLDLSDGVCGLTFLFLGGPPHDLGRDCVVVEGCPEVCNL